MVLPKKEFVLSHTFTDVSKMEKDISVFSPGEEHFNVSWNMSISCEGDHLGVFLHCHKSRGKETMWTIDTEHQFTLKTSSGKAYREDDNFNFQFSNAHSYGNGTTEFISWNKLIKDYLIDDVITVEAAVKIIKTTGISKKALKGFEKSNEEFSDVVLAVGDKEFFVLKQFLAYHSSYFKSLLLGKFAESDQKEVTLQDIDPTDFQNLLEVLYGEPAIDDETIDGILHLAHMYDMSVPLRKCEEFLINESEKSMKDQLKIAKQYQLEKLKKACLLKINTVDEIKAAVAGKLSDMDPTVVAALF
ncbi:BTB domain-containing protein [Caenorhabditis elegans]|uniref:BTB domain-containing protein n=1 Tax=Caenorhabditis elegans TaxID=6239 RepID=O76568_CAEEL|nr:BTB domain-containing protein [Caenorhabditis elegans]CCD70869.1 BTB domain-containing protein [Caenorhabditis elegans]|eukprot:NP_494287.1 BTB and MATH domain containing [Caenorhabditis elegans]